MNVFLALVLVPQFGQDTFVEPADYASASGAYVLHVEPSAPDGAGPGQYRMVRDGEPVWQRELPFTLVEAAVTDGGRTVGYACDQGVDMGRGFVHEVVVDEQGHVRLDRRTERGWYGAFICPPPPEPKVLGILLDEEHDRFVVRFLDEDRMRGLELWRVHSVSNAETSSEFRPAARLEREEGQKLRTWDARVVPGTGLFLLHGQTVTWGEDGNAIQKGSVFALVDVEGNVAWRLDRVHDLELEGDEREARVAEKRLRERGCLLDVPAPGTFDVRFVQEDQRVRFEVRPRPGGGWDVVESGRREFLAEERAAAEPATLGVLELEALEPVMLEHERAAPPVIRDVRAWAFGEGGGFDVIRDEEGQGRFSLVEVDGEGGRVRERSLDPLPEDVGRVLWTRLATRDWLAIWSGFGQGATSRLFRVDRATGTADELEGLDCPAVEAVAATADGGFVLLATHHYRHSMEKVVLAYDATPTLRWSRGEDREDPAGLSFPKDVAVTSDGRVLVLETVRKTIQEYADNGAHLGTLDLRQALGREPNYPAGISAGPDGSVLLDDFHGEPPLWQLDARGAVRGSWSPRFADGRPVEPRTVHFDADGALWGCDGYSFLQLDGEGLVQRVVGQPLAAEEILETGAATIDELGRPCVQDRRTGNVHVWGPDGRKRFLALLPPGGTDLPVRLGRISAGARGELQLGRYRWDASGRLLGQVDPRAPILDPRTGGYWVRTGGHWARKEPVGLRLLDSNGEEIATLDRRPDGSWFKDIRDVATGPAGQLAVLDAPYLFLFSAEREPLRTFELPDSVSGPMQLRDVALGPSWAVLTGWGPSWLLLRLEDGTFFRFEPELTKSEGSQYEAALSADGRELRILAVHELRVLRFALSRG